jgi:sugar lactone lactonase YvrE
MRPLRLRLLLPTALLALAVSAPAAQAIEACPESTAVTPLVTGHGWVESVAFDLKGRLLFTDTGVGQLWVLDKPGGKARVLAKGIPAGGGIVVTKRYAYVGTGNSFANGQHPDNGAAGIVRVDLKSGRTKRVVSGLAMANGVVRTSAGGFFASNAFGPGLDKVSPSGKVTPNWATLDANGLALSADGRFLYANRSKPPTRTVRINVRTGHITNVALAPTAADNGAFLDGLTLGAKNVPYAAAWIAGQIWKADGTGVYCRLAGGLTQPTSLAFGVKGRGFDTKSLYVGTAQGLVQRVRIRKPIVVCRRAASHKCRTAPAR